MARRILSILCAAAVLALAAGGPDFPVAGTWEGQINDLPGVELTVKDNKGEISGSIGFYFQTRGEDGKWRLGEKFEVPLLSPKLEGKVLTFETIHHKKHGSPELGPNNKYQVTFVDANEARLKIITEEKQDDGSSGLKLTRR